MRNETFNLDVRDSWLAAQRETILTVADDPDVRAFTVETVCEPGYDPGVQLITKPFAFDDLAVRIRGVLDGQDSARHAT